MDSDNKTPAEREQERVDAQNANQDQAVAQAAKDLQEGADRQAPGSSVEQAEAIREAQAEVPPAPEPGTPGYAEVTGTFTDAERLRRERIVADAEAEGRTEANSIEEANAGVPTSPDSPYRAHRVDEPRG